MTNGIQVQFYAIANLDKTSLTVLWYLPFPATFAPGGGRPQQPVLIF